MPRRGLTEGKNSNFIFQAGILAAAGIISSVIGLLYRGPLSGVIGDLGLGYYQSAYTFYTIILLISSYSIPSAISKVIAQRLAVKEYRNAHKMFMGSLYYVLVVGFLASLLLFFGAGLFVEDTAIPVLRVFAPTIFFYGILGVLRGYFQAHRSMLQTSCSQIIEQVANAVVSVGAAVLLIKHFMGTMEVPADEGGQITRAVYGAMGSALGTGAGVLVALIFMLIAYYVSRQEILGRVASDTHERTEGYGLIFRTITLTVTPFILSTAIYNLSASINTKLYTDLFPTLLDRFAEAGKMEGFLGKIRLLPTDHISIMERWGAFSSKAQIISNIPIRFASAMASAMIPSIAQLAAAKERSACRSKIRLAMKVTMLIAIPCAVGLFVFSGPITLLLFPSSAANLAVPQHSLMALSLSVIFYSVSTLNSSILQGLGKVNTPMWNAGIALIVQTILAFLLLLFTPLDVYSIAVANTVYSGLIAYLNQRSVHKAIRYSQEVRKTFFLPFVASLMMGLGAYGFYRVVLALTKSPRISVLPAIALAAVLYFVFLLLLQAVGEHELLALPKGAFIVKVAKKMRLLKTE
jgi:stage V sporulation protein B